MSNFQFLNKEWSQIFEIAKEAEDMANIKARSSLVNSRAALEKGIRWMYENDERLFEDYDKRKTVQNLLQTKSLKIVTNKPLRRELHLLQKLGNEAAHGELTDVEKANAGIKILFQFCSHLAISYSSDEIAVPVFDEALIPKGKKVNETQNELEIQIKKLEAQFKNDQLKRETLETQKEELESLRKELELKSKKLAERAESRGSKIKHIPQLIPESVTRKLYIDVLLKEAGWNKLTEGRELEYEVKGMPLSTNPSGIGYVDYVLWGDDGNPLAVVEAKKASRDAEKGKQQAVLYANCLEQMTGQRPIIFYTNGFDTRIWDDLFYSPRNISGFYTKDELQLLIQRRTTRKDLRTFKINKKIAGKDRPYQIEAIKRVAENLGKTHEGRYVGTKRESLLVMATGSGKTRTAAAIVDMLTKCNWAKRVLFLADRNALVTQAKNAFNEHLEDLSSIDLTKEKENSSTRLVFSTYPTIINKIDKLRTKDERFYGVGHFDLIIIDEAHRSIYQKYKAIFEYFDSMLIGLTATPKKDIDRNTYSLFGIEDDDPTFAYELNKAVTEGFLVTPRSISIPLKFPREGIKYNELSEREKQEYEEEYGDPTSGEVPDTIGSGALNDWVLNTDTVDKVLEHLMRDGIKVSGGDKLGKTIIFAKNHRHAVFIEERFNKNYPEYSGHFLRVIDNYESKAQDLLEKFTDPFKEQDPQIAVSVDMMDTGVDAPRVVNLVFFKMVKSSSKFWQMIGRGTRLCPDLFGPGEDKKEFMIFDYCQNFEFFDEFPDGAETKNMKPLLQQIFEAKLKVAQLISDLPEKKSVEVEVRDSYLDELHKTIQNLDENRFVVRKELRYVNDYCNKDKWLNLSKSDVQDINSHLSHLQPASRDDDELARRFDMLILIYQILLLSGSDSTGKYMSKIFRTAASLQKKDNIPQVSIHIPLIKEVQTDQYWNSINVKKLDSLRNALRDLIKYLDTQKQEPIYTHFEDELDYDGIVVRGHVNTSYESLQSYKDRVESYIRKNKDHLTIHKLRKNIPITKEELNAIENMLFTESVAGTKEQFIQQYGEKPLGAFIRSVTGLEQSVLNEAFADFLQVGDLRADQMTFINTIISYLSKNGTINKNMLYEPPFTDLNDQGISGVFDNDADLVKIIKIIDLVNDNAMIA
ncbi:DEAD/DEAH box helicase family protein [Flavobacteriaceae bacterium]|nr:DEAD/DEAH box helicase family protein [Flavobacteriaceae bacterium]